jgi:hypothetical protein
MRNWLLTGLLACALSSPVAFADDSRTKSRSINPAAEQNANAISHEKGKHHKKHKAQKPINLLIKCINF